MEVLVVLMENMVFQNHIVDFFHDPVSLDVYPKEIRHLLGSVV